MRRLPRFLSLAALLLLPVAAAPVAFSDDPPKKERPTKDDTSIVNDFKLAKVKGIGYHKERGEFWEQKGTSGKDLYWLARFFEVGEVYDKAAAVFEQYLGWEPPASDPNVEKLRSDKEKNAENARLKLIDLNLRRKEFAKAVEWAQKYRAANPQDANNISASYDLEGRAQRLAGDLDKAFAAWNQAISRDWAAGLIDLCDALFAEGRYDEAKAAAAKWTKEGDAAKNPFVQSMQAFTGAANGLAPALDKAVNVGRGEVTFAGKPTLFYFFHLQVNFVDKKINALEGAARTVGEKANVCGIATYNKYNPETMKVEEDMTADKEIEWYKKSTDAWSLRLPCVVVEKPVLEALFLKYESQMVIVDGEGKLRWMRIGKDETYDRWSAELALKKIAGVAAN